MPKMMTVGKSDRTVGKHEALRKISGKIAGVSTKSFKELRKFYIDLTAGNGIATDFENETSPGLMLKQAAYTVARGQVAEVHLFERDKDAYDSLVASIVRYLQQAGHNLSCETYCKSSIDMERFWDDNDMLFVVNDPNSIDGLRYPPALRDAPRHTTIFTTLGANAGGVKRLPADRRMQWYRPVEDQIALLQPNHDAYLAKLCGDSSQWAYLINTPIVWRREVECIFQKSFAYGYNVTGHWHKRDRAGFYRLLDQLVLTRKEQ